MESTEPQFPDKVPDHGLFYVEAASANTAKTVTYDPKGAEHNVYIYFIVPSYLFQHIRSN